jgi:hypothetical protein
MLRWFNGLRLIDEFCSPTVETVGFEKYRKD